MARSRALGPGCLLAALALFAAPAGAQSRKVSAPLPCLPGRVVEHWTTRDGSWCVFLANPEVQDPSLFSVSLTRREKPNPLSQSLHPSRHGVRLAPDGARVVFAASSDLYTVAIDGSEDPVLVAGVSVTGDSIGDSGFELTPDGGRVVFWAQRSFTPYELYSQSLDDPASRVRLASARAASGHLGEFSFTPDGTEVVYTTDQDALGAYELYCVALDGSGGARKLSGTLDGNRDVADFEITADGTQVVYRADGDRNDDLDLYVVELDGSASPRRLSGPVVRGGDVFEFTLLPGTDRVLYRADQTINERMELFSAPIDGSAPPVQLNGLLVAGGDVHSFRATSDGTRVVYVADEEVDGVPTLHVVPADGGAASRRLDGPPVFDTSPEQVRIGSGERVVYVGEDDTGVLDLHAVGLAPGAAAVQLTHSPEAEGGHWLELSPDGTRVVYRSFPEYPRFSELRSVPIDGSQAPVLLGLVGPDLYSEAGFSIAPDSRSLLYVSDEWKKGALELYQRPIDAGGRPVRRSMSMLPGPVVGDAYLVGADAGGEHAVYQVYVYAGSFETYVPPELWSAPLHGLLAPRRIFSDRLTQGLGPAFDPSGRWVVFIGWYEEGVFAELWSALADGTRPAVRLSEPTFDPITPGNDVHLHSVATTGRLVFATYDEVFASSLDGSTGPLRLAGPAGLQRSVSHLEIDPLGTRAVYSIYDFGRRVFELYSVATDASTAPVKLSEAGFRGGSLRALRIATPSDRVVYIADQDTDDVVELYSVSLDGSASPVKLSGNPVLGGDVTTPLLITPDGRRAVYVADSSVDELIGIYSVPIDGSAAPVELYRPLVRGLGLLQDLRLTPDGKRVTFLADHDDDGSFDLFSTSVTRGRPGRLNGPLVSGGSVTGYVFGPMGLVYRADQDADEVFELYGVPTDAPTDGRRPPVRLHVPLGPDADVQAGFLPSPDGAHVVFAADARHDEVVELFAVPLLRGNAVPQPLHAPLGAGGDVVADVPENLTITPDSRHVLFVADGETDEVFEVFESPLPSGTPGRVRPR